MILPDTFLTVQKSSDSSKMTDTKIPMKDPENKVPNKYTVSAETRKKKWKKATHGLFSNLFWSLLPKSLSKSILPWGSWDIWIWKLFVDVVKSFLIFFFVGSKISQSWPYFSKGRFVAKTENWKLCKFSGKIQKINKVTKNWRVKTLQIFWENFKNKQIPLKMKSENSEFSGKSQKINKFTKKHKT